MTHDQKTALISAVISFVIALLAIFGYNVVVVQPAIDQVMALSLMEPARAATNLDDLTLIGDLRFGPNGLYPVGSQTSGNRLVPGTVLTPVQKATVPATVHNLATVTWAQCEPRTKSFTGAWTCGTQIGASNQLTLTLYNTSATPVPTAAWGGINWIAAGR